MGLYCVCLWVLCKLFVVLILATWALSRESAGGHVRLGFDLSPPSFRLNPIQAADPQAF